MKTKRDGLFIVAFILVVGISLLYLFQTSYAKYRRTNDATVQARIASWDVKINNESIINQTTLSNTIIPTIDTNQHVKSGMIAPGSTGSYEIRIDATNVDVDFTYTIMGEVDDETPLSDFVITGYKINDGTLINYNEAIGITGDIPMNTSQTKIEIFFEWKDDATNQMDNQEDTEYAQNDDYRDTYINTTIHFEQKR